MARSFTLPSFLRKVPHSLLKRFFQLLEIDTHDLSWELIKNREAEPFLELFRDLPPEKQNQMEGICYDVFELSCGSGWDALCEMAESYHAPDWFALSPEKTTLQAKSLWTWVNHPLIFQKAHEFHQMKNTSWWRKREGLPKMVPEWNGQVKTALEGALQIYFMEKQGRGQVCTVQMQNFRDDTYYFLAYPDDYVRNVMRHNDKGELVSRRTRPTFEIVYAYNSVEGTLELHTRGGDKTKSDLEEIFIETVLGEEVEVFSGQIYDLSAVKQSGFSLTPDPKDNVLIQIKQVRLNWGQDTSVQFRAEKERDLLAWIRRVINAEYLPWDKAVVDYIKLQFLFLPTEWERRGTLTFEMNTPNRSTLRGKNPRKVEIIRKYLKKWGIEYEQSLERAVDKIGC